MGFASLYFLPQREQRSGPWFWEGEFQEIEHVAKNDGSVRPEIMSKLTAIDMIQHGSLYLEPHAGVVMELVATIRHFAGVVADRDRDVPRWTQRVRRMERLVELCDDFTDAVTRDPSLLVSGYVEFGDSDQILAFDAAWLTSLCERADELVDPDHPNAPDGVPPKFSRGHLRSAGRRRWLWFHEPHSILAGYAVLAALEHQPPHPPKPPEPPHLPYPDNPERELTTALQGWLDTQT